MTLVAGYIFETGYLLRDIAADLNYAGLAAALVVNGAREYD